ncbi:MAG: pilus assembly protein N-terminal domain-containing protein [Planctomycetaceae bacterium]
MSADLFGSFALLRRLRTTASSLARRAFVAGTVAGTCLAMSSADAQIGLPGLHHTQPQGQPQVAATPVAMSMQPDSTVSGRVDAIHSPNVQKLLSPQYKLDLERRHSQLVITNRNIRRIAVTDSTVANYVQYSPTEVAVVGLEIGKTDLAIWFEGEAAPSIYEVSVVRDHSLEEQRQTDFGRLERRLSVIFPNSNVYLEPVGNQVIIKGQAYDSQEASQIMQIVRTEVFSSFGRYNNFYDQGGAGAVSGINGQFGQNQFQNGIGAANDIVVNMLQVPGEFNIKMRVVIAEVDRSQMRNAGIDWDVFFNNGRHVVSGALGGLTGTTLSGVFENGEIGVFVRWLATNGTATLLAEPTIVCMSGHSASLLAGGEFAVPTIIGLGGGQNTTFRGIGTSMIVTPTVIDRDLIRLQIVPEFSALNNTNAVNGIPGTTVKRVQTTVELREGQTLALGGLISRKTNSSVSRIPLLGDIPFIGSRIFHAKNADEGETELLVLVSPEIVRPMEPDEVPPLPNYYVTHPNDHDLWKYGRTEGNPDTNVYQVQPFGSGATYGVPQGYSLFNPPVNGPGFTPTQTAMSPQPIQYNGGYDQSAQYLTPQPDMMLPPASGYQSPAPMYQAPPAYQQMNPAPQMGVPGAAPQTPLPPIPGGYQGSIEPAGKSNESMLTKMGNLFRGGQAAEQNNRPIHTVGWTR